MTCEGVDNPSLFPPDAAFPKPPLFPATSPRVENEDAPDNRSGPLLMYKDAGWHVALVRNDILLPRSNHALPLQARTNLETGPNHGAALFVRVGVE